MASALASRRWAASSLALPSTVSDATWTAEPAVCSEREPIVPEPRGISSVSLCRIVTLSIGTPSMSDTIIENAVS